jgi:hypothetical protein
MATLKRKASDGGTFKDTETLNTNEDAAIRRELIDHKKEPANLEEQ